MHLINSPNNGLDEKSDKMRVYHNVDCEWRAKMISDFGLIKGMEPSLRFQKWLAPKVDSYRPDWVKKRGISRQKCIYAFHSLKDPLFGRVKAGRATAPNEWELELYFQAYQERLQNIKSVREFIKLMQDPDFRDEYYKKVDPGELFGFDVDPNMVIVADMGIITRLAEMIEREAKMNVKNFNEDNINELENSEEIISDVRDGSIDYWKSVMTLKNFLENYEKRGLYYEKTRKNDSNRLRKDIRHAPKRIEFPEILVPYDIPADQLDIVGERKGVVSKIRKSLFGYRKMVA
jgi:hypothetical protein